MKLVAGSVTICLKTTVHCFKNSSMSKRKQEGSKEGQDQEGGGGDILSLPLPLSDSVTLAGSVTVLQTLQIILDLCVPEKELAKTHSQI
jgi:hypothetical protein